MRRKLGEICKFYSGTGFPTKYQGKTDGEFPFYKVGDISRTVQNGNYQMTVSDNYVDSADVESIKGSIIPVGTVVFAKIGEALRLNRRAITTMECLVDNNAMGIKADEQYLRTGYFFYFMEQLDMQKYSEATAVPSVRKSRLQGIEIECPDLTTQDAITDRLDHVSAVISLRKRQISELDTLIKARFVEMFGQPGEDKFGWGITLLGDACYVNPKKNSDSRLDSGVEVSFVPMTSVSEHGELDASEIRDYDEVKKGFTYFAENDVLFAKITPCMENGKGAVASGLYNGIGFGSTEFHVLRPLEGRSNPYWLYVLTSFPEFRREAARKMTGSAGQRRVPASFLQRYQVSVPPIELQNQFADFVHQVDKSKSVVQKSLDETQVLFDSLMQKYFG